MNTSQSLTPNYFILNRYSKGKGKMFNALRAELLTSDLYYALELHRSCLFSGVNLSWSLLKKSKLPLIDEVDVVIIDLDQNEFITRPLHQERISQYQDVAVVTVGSEVPPIGLLKSMGAKGFCLKTLDTNLVVETVVKIGNR